MPPILLSEMLCGKNPTVIVSTRNPDGSINLTVCSDLYLLAKHFVLTLPSESQTIGNLLSAKNCVLNIPPQKLAPALRRLMRTTGSRGFAAAHNGQGLRYTRAKFAKAKLTPCRSIEVATAGVEECPIRVEAELVHVHCSPDTSIKAVELRVLRVNADTSIMKVGSQSEIDSEKWQPIQSDSRDLRVAPEQATHLENQAGDNDDTQKAIQMPLKRATRGLQARPLVKTRAPQARYPVIAASPSVTSLRALHDNAEPIATNRRDNTDDLTPEANALDNSPTDLRGECLGSDVLLIQLHAIGLVLGCVLFFVCQ
ncbi:MAG: hypothetical protein L6R42_003387 [Xanthoria sp. 1 TBL-2021]|nr:MAG: hypothetical protein L6R42_003387 [Xanthoria sp. 1 TBL-2021]